MERRPAEEAVVIVKSGAWEVVVTQLRRKRQASSRKPEVKGGPRKRSMKLIRDYRPEISRNGAVVYSRRKDRANRPCEDRGKTYAKTRVK
jgi:hypothetical protein